MNSELVLVIEKTILDTNDRTFDYEHEHRPSGTEHEHEPHK